MAITALVNVDSAKGSGKITFDAITDGNADEVVSTTIDGERFATTVKGTAASIPGSISHTKSGLHTVVLRAESSNVQSQPLLLDL